MLLFEYEAKAMLGPKGVRVPRGGLWPLPIAAVGTEVMVKAQVLSGGRGKRGGIRPAASQQEADAYAREMLAGSSRLPPARAVLLEERIATARELYLSILMDRNERCPVLLASAAGGVEVETVAHDQLLRFPLALGSDVPVDVRSAVGARLRLTGDLYQRMDRTLSAVWEVFQEQDCLLLEINPLAVTTSGELAALDARIIVDDSARPRHPDWEVRRDGTPFEAACAALGATGVEMSGDVAIITSGAGLGMATVDMVSEAGGRPSCFVDLGGTALDASGSMSQIIGLVWERRPSVILIAYFLQLARGDLLTKAIGDALAQVSPACPLVVRMKGNKVEEGRRCVDRPGITVTDDLRAACERAVALAGQRDTAAG